MDEELCGRCLRQLLPLSPLLTYQYQRCRWRRRHRLDSGVSMAYLLLSTCAALALVFALSAANKASRKSFHDFVTSAGPLEVLPEALRLPAAYGVVAVEAALAIALVVGAGGAFSSRLSLLAIVGFVLAITLLLAFTTAIVLTLRRGVRKACKCFGATSTPLGRAHVVRNLLLLVLAVAGLVAALTQGAPLQPAGAALAVMAGVIGGLLITRFDDLLDLFSPTDASVGV
ncbi:MauE/DoxX family redox-associated membrane protein [Kribbella deserti]|uniref:MauE/DoxX family redox-associated membrane protein n=1 Tax=Kribbella deserti TaxID=1926257 RepID=A0ABV6QTX3_9ACTN